LALVGLRRQFYHYVLPHAWVEQGFPVSASSVCAPTSVNCHSIIPAMLVVGISILLRSHWPRNTHCFRASEASTARVRRHITCSERKSNFESASPSPPNRDCAGAVGCSHANSPSTYCLLHWLGRVFGSNTKALCMRQAVCVCSTPAILHITPWACKQQTE
jgi:hypothetical protein